MFVGTKECSALSGSSAYWVCKAAGILLERLRKYLLIMEKLSGGGSYDLKQVLGNGPDS